MLQLLIKEGIMVGLRAGRNFRPLRTIGVKKNMGSYIIVAIVPVVNAGNNPNIMLIPRSLLFFIIRTRGDFSAGRNCTL